MQVASDTGKPAVGDQLMGPVAHVPLVAIAVPGLRDGKASHFVLTTIEAREFQVVMDQATIPSGWLVTLRDGTNAILAKRGSAPVDADSAMQTAKQFVARSSLSPWSIVVDIPRRVYFAPMINAGLALALAILVAGALAILGGKLAARRLGRSIASLANPSAEAPPTDDIAEISATRRLLNDSLEKREQAETARRDAEERARVEIEAAARKLVLSEQRLRGIFESATDAIVTADERQVIVMANPAAARIFRCQLDDLLGAPLDRVIPARFHEMHRRYVQEFGPSVVDVRSMGGGRRITGLRFDGEEFPIEASISHLTVGEERLYTVMLRDITARERNRIALQRYADIVESSHDAILSRSLDGHILTWNAAAERIFGYTREEMSHLTIASLYSPNTPPADRDLVARAMEGQPVVNFETIRRSKDGSDIDVAITISLLRDRDGQVAGSSAIYRDITRRVRTEHELHESLRQQKLAEAALRESRDSLRELSSALQSIREEEKTRIARELHDELGQALTALRMDAAAIAEELLPAQTAATKRVQDMTQLINATVLSVRRIATDLRPMMLDNLGLAATLEWLTKDFSARTGVAVDLYMPDEELGASGDAATAVFRIVQEALTNVARHAQATEVHVDVLRKSGTVYLRVSDNGVGMPPQSSGRVRSFGVLGMRERTYVLGGSFTIESQPGEGTTIEVTIPRFGNRGGTTATERDGQA